LKSTNPVRSPQKTVRVLPQSLYKSTNTRYRSTRQMVNWLKMKVPKQHCRSQRSKPYTALRSLKSANTNHNVTSNTAQTQGKVADVEHCYSLLKGFRRLKKTVKAYLQTKYGGAKKPKMASQFAQTFYNFLQFAFLRLKQQNNVHWTGLPIDKNIRVIIKSKYNIVDAYLDQFEKILKASTILNKWNHVLICLRWFNYYSPMNDKRGSIQLSAFEHHMKTIRKALVKQKNKDALQNTMENMIKKGKLPPNGLQQLHEYVSSDYQWAMSLQKEDFLNPKTYNHFTSWLYASFYMSVQGRVGGIEDMRYGQRHGLMLADGHELSTNFKTSHHHSYQAVSSSEMSSKGIKLYVEIARPVIVGNNNSLNEDAAELFLTSTGKPEYLMGKKISNYFSIKSNGSLHVTSTAIRCMYETTADDLYEKGLITLEEKSSVTRLGGHSGAIVDQHYIKKNLRKAVTCARKVMDIEYTRSNEIDGTLSCDLTAHAPAIDTALSNTPVPPAPVSTPSQHVGDDLDFSYDIFGEMDDVSDETHEVDSHGSMDWFNLGISSSSVGTAGDSTASTASTTSFSAVDANTAENPMGYNAMRRAPLPLHGCGIGQSHKARRVLWTQQEIDKTRDLYKFIIVTLPDEQKRLIASCIWDHIVNKMDPREVAEIYHPAHITDSQKLRHCIRMYIEPFLGSY